MQNVIQTALNAYFFSKKMQEMSSFWGLRPQAPVVVTCLMFSRTQFSQPTTLKIVIARFLNEQRCHEVELFPRNLLDYNTVRFH